MLHLLIQSDISKEKFFLKDYKTFPTIQKLVEYYCHKTKDSYVFLLEEPSKGRSSSIKVICITNKLIFTYKQGTSSRVSCNRMN